VSATPCSAIQWTVRSGLRGNNVDVSSLGVQCLAVRISNAGRTLEDDVCQNKRLARPLCGCVISRQKRHMVAPLLSRDISQSSVTRKGDSVTYGRSIRSSGKTYLLRCVRHQGETSWRQKNTYWGSGLRNTSSRRTQITIFHVRYERPGSKPASGT
jgi:hypothetical protein